MVVISLLDASINRRTFSPYGIGIALNLPNGQAEEELAIRFRVPLAPPVFCNVKLIRLHWQSQTRGSSVAYSSNAMSVQSP
jgi:hypothetical protein